MSATLPSAHPIDKVLTKLSGVQQDARRANIWKACCPAHLDTHPSLKVTEDPNGTVLLKCWAGCDNKSIVAAIGLTLADLFPPRVTNAAGGPRITRYEYRDAGGALVAIKERHDYPSGRKATPWKHPAAQCSDSTCSQHWGLNGTAIADLPLYRLPELLASDPAEPVIVVEGEKTCEAARSLGFTAVTTAGGAAQSDFGRSLDPLAGRTVYLWPDNDAAGRDLMDRLADQLEGLAAKVYRLDVPGLREKDDAADFVDKGRTADELRALMNRAPEHRDWTASWARQRIADLEKRNAELEARLAESEETAAAAQAQTTELRTTVRAINDVLGDQRLNDGERVMAIVLALEASATQNRKPGPDGGYRNSLKMLAERAGCSRATASTRTTRLARWGYCKKRTVRTLNEDTGKWYSELFIDVGDRPAAETMSALQTLEIERETPARPTKKTGGCPDCGDAGTVTYCRGCGQILRETKPGECLDSKSLNSELDPLSCDHLTDPVPNTSRSANPEPIAVGDERLHVMSPDELRAMMELPEPSPAVDLCACGAPLPPGHKYRCAACVEAARRKEHPSE